MAATVIDQLIVDLSLDPTKFNAGQKQAVNNLRQFQQQAQNMAQQAQQHASQVTNAVNRLRGEVLSLSAAFIGLKGASGFVGFLQNTIQGVTETGRLARTLNVSVDSLNKWQTALRLGGVSAGSANSALAGLLQTFAQIRVQGMSGEAFQWLQNIVPNIQEFLDASGLIKEEKIPQLLEAMAAGFQRINKEGTGMASLFASRAGIPPDALQFFLLGPQRVREMIEEAQRLAPITAEMARNAERTSNAWAEAATSWDGIVTKGSLFFAEGATLFGKGLTNLAGLFKKAAAGELKFDLSPQKGSPLDTLFHGGEGGGVPVKEGAGSQTLATKALAAYLAANVQGFNRVTAFDDAYHAGKGKHGEGLALDFTVKGGNYQAAQAAEQVRTMLQQLGIHAFVGDEYNHPGATTTAGHIHVGFASQADASTFRQATGFTDQSTANQSNTTNNWHLSVQVKDGDPNKVATQISSALMNTPWYRGVANNANGGSQ